MDADCPQRTPPRRPDAKPKDPTMKLRTRFGATIALALGVVVIIASIVGGIAFANRGNGPSSTPAVMVGNEDNGTPGTTHSEGVENGDLDDHGDHDATASPEPSCEAGDDGMENAEPEAERSAEPEAERSAEPEAERSAEPEAERSAEPE